MKRMNRRINFFFSPSFAKLNKGPVLKTLVNRYSSLAQTALQKFFHV